MDKHDRHALKLAMALCRAEDEACAEQIDSMLEDRSWAEVSAFAASHCQSRALRLAPWQQPPCNGDSKHHPDPDARALLEQMLALGVSRWHPDPMAALEETKRKGVAHDRSQ